MPGARSHLWPWPGHLCLAAHCLQQVPPGGRDGVGDGCAHRWVGAAGGGEQLVWSQREVKERLRGTSPSPQQRDRPGRGLWGTQGIPGQGWLEASSLHPQAHKEGGYPTAGGGRKLCPGGHPRPMAAPGGSGGERQRETPLLQGHRPLSPSLACCPPQAPLPWPGEVLVLFSWILPLRGFSWLHGCFQGQIWLLRPWDPL